MEVMGVVFIFFIYAFFIGAELVIVTIGKWKCLEKAGEKGWKSLIPVYNTALMYKLSGISPLWVLVNVIFDSLYIFYTVIFTVYTESGEYDEIGMAVVVIILALLIMLLSAGVLALNIVWAIKFSKSFNKGGGYAVGLIFVPIIFFMIIGFGDAKYIGNSKNKVIVE